MRKTLHAVVSIIGCLSSSGCIIVPLPESGHLAGRSSLQQSDLAFLEKGRTTREDVLLRLGEPDLSSPSGDVLIYCWSGSGGFWAAGGLAWAGGGAIAFQHRLALEFGTDGSLVTVEQTDSREFVGRVNDRCATGDAAPLRWELVVDPVPEVWMHPKPAGDGTPLARIKLGEFRDAREAPYAGTLVAATPAWFKHLEVHTAEPPAAIVRAVLARHLEGAGFLLVDHAEDRSISGIVHQFEMSKWFPAVGLDLTIEVRSGSSTILSRHLYETSSFIDNVYFVDKIKKGFADVLTDLQRQLVADSELTKFLAESPTGTEPAKP